MMVLTEQHRDALTELINIAFSKTAASLSDLTNNRVELEVPHVSVRPIAELNQALQAFVNGEVATVHQIFAGPVAGDGLLLMTHDGAAELVHRLTGEDAPSGRLRTSAKEVLTEIGNILLNSCLGVFGDLLEVRIIFTVPRLHLESLGSLLDSLVIGKTELQHALLAGAKFRVENSEVTGCLAIVLGVDSFERLLQAVQDWAARATSPPP
jgi:chemotaxis protein CheC